MFNRHKKIIYLLFNILIIFSAIILFANSLDYSEINKVISSINYNYLLLCSVPLFMAHYFDAVRLFAICDDTPSNSKLLLKKIKKISAITRVFMASLPFSFVLPGSLGVEGYRIIKLHGILQKEEIINSFLLSKFFAVLTTISIFLILLFLNHNYSISFINKYIQDIRYGFGLIFGLSCILLIIIFFRKKLSKFFRGAAKFLMHFSLNKIFMIIFLSITIEILKFLSLYFILVLCNIDINLIEILILSIISTVSLMIPFTFQGLGLREIAFTYSLNFYGFSITESILVSAVSRVVILIPIVVSFIFLIPNIISKKN